MGSDGGIGKLVALICCLLSGNRGESDLDINSGESRRGGLFLCSVGSSSDLLMRKGLIDGEGVAFSLL